MHQTETSFLTLLNMSITAGYVILFVLAARLCMRKLPKRYSYWLWGAVGFRLICPVSFSSAFSLLGFIKQGGLTYIPADIGMMAKPEIDMGIVAVNNVLNQSLPPADPYQSINPMQAAVALGSIVWIAGMAVCGLCFAASYVLIRRRVACAIRTEENRYVCENLPSPFVLGLRKPRIYLPYGLTQEETAYIICHEQIHIKRRDPLIKVLACMLLCVYWFHPLVWLSYFLMIKDMEMSCDEQVIAEMGEQIKKPYSTSLLSIAAGRHFSAGSPLAFGEGGAKKRIKNILNYRKPPVWLCLGAGAAAVALLIVLSANPKDSRGGDLPGITEGETVGTVEETDALQAAEEPEKQLPFAHPMIFFQGKEFYMSDAALDLDPTRLQKIGTVARAVPELWVPFKEGDANTEIAGAAIYDSGDNIIVDENGGYTLYTQELPDKLAHYYEMKSTLESYPDDYTYEQAAADGWFTVVHGTLQQDSKMRMDQFLRNCREGIPSQLGVSQVTVEGDLILQWIQFDGYMYYLLEDVSRDAFRSMDDSPYTLAVFSHLKQFEIEGSSYLVLTSDKDLSISKWPPEEGKAQASSFLICFWEQ